ncbi:dihydroneopterin aldolase [Orbus hercynius]|uniref:7,8-dihydroneopterin aldolase n=1 Tax=Orbus hercynius TaxID=593135 RepID=A0A495RIX8_9GAMM|nr:dihydroneopterin aldolase [Orbus hercynius]RKS87361.1 dihydroneopterin aldolase [Orbus hercynius]
MTKDCVFIEGLAVITTIGVYEWEKTIKQKLVLDLEMAWDNRPAGLSDNVELCLDYAKVSQAIEHYVTHQQFGLIERVAEEVAQLVINDFSVSRVKIKVSKPGAIPAAQNVAVMIERQR